MGICASKPPPKPNPYARKDAPEYSEPPQTTPRPKTPGRRSFPPPSPANLLTQLNKNFGFSKKFASRFDFEEEEEQGNFGYTCSAIAKKGELKGQKVAVKIIPKSKMTTVIAIEEVRREVNILRALARHPNLLQFYDAFEDADNVYIVTEGGKYSEDYAKAIIIQILNVVAFCHLQGVVHRDVKPENFLFTSEDENTRLKAIDFGLSDFIGLEQKLNDVVGSAYYVAPEVIQKSYSTEADVWSIGVIAYILLSGSRPFLGRTESDIFQAVLKDNPSFNENPWPSLSSESKDFVRRLLHKDPSRRITAAQALCHPWLQNHDKAKLTLDVLVFRLMKGYMRSSSLRKAALRALSKTLTVDELFYLKEQFNLMLPDASGAITLDTIKMALMKNPTDALKEDRVLGLLDPLNALQYRKMYFEEFCAAALSVHQLEVLESWEQRMRCAYEMFEKNGNRVIVIEELASELGLRPTVPVHAVLQEWIRPSDGKLTFLGFVKLLLTQPNRSSAKIQ
ncbi:hypothetical protein DH2020_029410 [Rehmannia glutinosa]|uniref:Protein kinase domain-containing protein n=1 Tax=Rehmannia glutinosa TaxID=99300 RepID=A0ABR0VSS8_REHGL